MTLTLRQRYGDKTSIVRHRLRCQCDAIHILEFVLPKQKSWWEQFLEFFGFPGHKSANEINPQPISLCPPPKPEPQPPVEPEPEAPKYSGIPNGTSAAHVRADGGRQ
jgi:hypothetical protein